MLADLGDERRTPQFIETVHGRGYRFIGVVHAGELAENEARQTTLSPAPALHEQTPYMTPTENGVGQSTPMAVVSIAEPESQPSTVEIQPTHEENRVHRRWTRRGLMLGGVVLLGGVLLTLSVRHLFPLVTQHPSPGTQEAQPPALPLPDKPSLIVLPFVNLSDDPMQEYFSDGVTADITSTLSRLSNLFVISRTSAFTYKGKPTKLKEISREMGVQYALEGSVRKTDEHLRITVELIDATTDHPLWAEQYDRPPQNLFAVQDEIVHKIVTTLRLQLTLQEQGHIVRKHTDSLEAYDYFLRGLEHYWRYTKEANAQARQLFEKAVALDPQYAEAEAYLGWTYCLEWSWRWSADPQTLERTLALAQQASALDDSLPGAHSLLSYVYAYKQQYDQAMAEGERAIALDPNNADSYTNRANTLNFAGRPEEALRMVAQAMRLNPHCPPNYLGQLGWAYVYTGRYAEAITTLQETISRSPSYVGAHLNLALSYWLQWVSQQSPAAQTLEPAVAAVHRALALNDSWQFNHLVLGYISLYQQQYEPALAEVERTVALDPNEAMSYAALAEVLSRVGRTEEALEAAAQALRLKPLFADYHLAGVGTAYAVAGRYAEARAPLQRYLNRYPNILHIHLMLAAVYSELGKEAEARAEAAEVLRINPSFSLAVHRQRMPIKDPAVLERHLAALRKAGLK